MRRKAAEDMKHSASKRMYRLIFTFKILARRQGSIGILKSVPLSHTQKTHSIAVQVQARVHPSLPPSSCRQAEEHVPAS